MDIRKYFRKKRPCGSKGSESEPKKSKCNSYELVEHKEQIWAVQQRESEEVREREEVRKEVQQKEEVQQRKEVPKLSSNLKHSKASLKKLYKSRLTYNKSWEEKYFLYVWISIGENHGGGGGKSQGSPPLYPTLIRFTV